tara:strand:- start:15752 stop:16690 length:939 start_codon:yes stop_codon:yes gene_type:complete
MPRPRKVLVCRNDTLYYHCVSRCVRRAFLCGKDTVTQRCYEHRRAWVTERIHLLTSIFAIDICAYAVMSNHYHIVLKLNSSEAWSDEQVIDRWLCLFRGPILMQRARQGVELSDAERQTVAEIAAVWRLRLQDLSWFMKCLNEPIARMANQEDNCTGHFWESRFKSQALRSEKALLSCMAYVDLNPIRACMATSPESSDFTSIQERITEESSKIAKAVHVAPDISKHVIPPKPLLPFTGPGSEKNDGNIPFGFTDYVQLVDWTGRIQQKNKSGSISPDIPPILSRFNIPARQWLVDSTEFEHIVHRRFGRSG